MWKKSSVCKSDVIIYMCDDATRWRPTRNRSIDGTVRYMYAAPVYFPLLFRACSRARVHTTASRRAFLSPFLLSSCAYADDVIRVCKI